jgi:hypothetical protein
MNIEEAKKCTECEGIGELSLMESVYPGTPDSYIQAPIGSEPCSNCIGTGLEPYEDIVRERLLDNLTEEQEKKLKDYFIIQKESGGIPITKDNVEDLFEPWLSQLELLEVIELIK